jgi:hypothetical protein
MLLTGDRMYKQVHIMKRRGGLPDCGLRKSSVERRNEEDRARKAEKQGSIFSK